MLFESQNSNAKPKRVIAKPKKWTNCISLFLPILSQVPTKPVTNLAPSTMGPMSLLVYDSTCSRANFQNIGFLPFFISGSILYIPSPKSSKRA